MFNGAGFSRVRRFAVSGLLWGGLLLCGVAVQSHWHESNRLLSAFGLGGAAIIGMAFLVIWLLAVASWRQVVAACSGQEIPWIAAARHLTLLLLGKYIPGGVWGFIARLSASTAYGSPAAMVVAGLAEQWVGLAMVSLLGGVALLAAYLKYGALMLGAVLFPLVVVVSLRIAVGIFRWFAEYMPKRWRRAASSVAELQLSWKMLWAAVLTMFQVILSLGIVAAVASVAFGLDPYATLAVAGSYGVGIMVGIVAIFMPGGILVREAVFVVLCRDWITPAEAIALAGGLRLIFTAFDLSAGAGGVLLQLRGRRHV